MMLHIIREYTLKRHTTAHLLKCPKSRTLLYPVHTHFIWWRSQAIGTYTLLVKMQNGTATLEKSLISYKRKHILTIQSSSHTWYLLKGVENLHPHEMCTLFMVVLFITAKTWKQSIYPSVGEWINCDTARLWSIILH